MTAAGGDLAAALADVAPGWPAALREAVVRRAGVARAPDGAPLFGPGDPCRAWMIPLTGAVRVEYTSAAGRSVVLYRVGPGDSCVMTASCLIGGQPYQAWGRAEGALSALALPAAAFAELLDGDAGFRRVALSVFSRRVVELVEVIDDLLLHRVDLRLAEWLAAQGQRSIVALTHQAIAEELGAAREVVSRILKDFEGRGWVMRARGAVEVRDADALRRFGESR